jgi:topoisomerase-4 subunit A
MTHYLEPLMERNFLEYASYVIVDRAIPDLRDGCKPVQRRILHTLYEMEDGKFHKVANVIGETMKLHPHGDASIGDALVVLANKEYFIEKQGNYGSVVTGHAAAAPRYIECRLSDLAKETLFNNALTRFMPSYDGRKDEPEILPSKLPVLLLLGAEGIAVGMATKILPHNFSELLQAQIRILEGKPVSVYPDFIHGGIMDVSEYADGAGKIRVRALIEPLGDKKIVIKEIPYSTTTESLIASVESAIQKGKVKIAGISDFTTEKVEIELTLPRGVYADEVIPQLYAYTDCEVSISSNVVVIDGKHPREGTVKELLKDLTNRLVELLKAELEYTLEELESKHHWLVLEHIFIENKVYKRLEKADTEERLSKEVFLGMNPFAQDFVRPLTEQDVKKLLDLRIRRISAFDIEKHHKDVTKVLAEIKTCKNKLKNLTQTTVDYLQYLIQTYGARWPRKTKVKRFDVVDKKSVALQNIKVSYDEETGFWGTDVKGKEYPLSISEYDLVLAVCDDGSYRIMTPQPKVLLPSKVLYCAVFNPEQGDVFSVVYRDKKKTAYAKKVHVKQFIRNKEYSLLPKSGGKIEVLLHGDVACKIQGQTLALGKGRVVNVSFDLKQVETGTAASKGVKIHEKPVGKLAVVK